MQVSKKYLFVLKDNLFFLKEEIFLRDIQNQKAGLIDIICLEDATIFTDKGWGKIPIMHEGSHG